MADITHVDPFKELDRFTTLRNLNDFFKGMKTPDLAEPQIKLDVSEDDRVYTVKAEVPGVKKEDIEVSIDGNVVSIGVEIKREKEDKEGTKVIRSERYFGKQSRSFSLAADIDQAGASAAYQDGLLTLTLPKKPGVQAKKIAVA